MKKQFAVLLATILWPFAASAQFSEVMAGDGAISAGNNVFPIISGVVALGVLTGAAVVYTVWKRSGAEAVAYSEENKALLLADLARQEGPYLETYGALLGCHGPAAAQKLAQITGPQLITADTIQQDPRLWVACVGAL